MYYFTSIDFSHTYIYSRYMDSWRFQTIIVVYLPHFVSTRTFSLYLCYSETGYFLSTEAAEAETKGKRTIVLDYGGVTSTTSTHICEH